MFNTSGKEREAYMGGLGILWEGLDNPLEAMLYYLILISLWVAIYTLPITKAFLETSDKFITKFSVFSYMVLQFRLKTVSKP